MKNQQLERNSTMKRKLVLTLTCFSILTLLMTGCGKVETVADAENTTATESESTNESVVEPSSELAQADITATPSPAPAAPLKPAPTASPEPAARNITSDYSVTDLSIIMYAKSAVNVRSLPDTTGDKIGNLTQNQEVTVTGKCNETGWYEIAYDGGTAYVSDSYLVAQMAVATTASGSGRSTDNSGTQTASTGKSWTQDEYFMISIAGEACTDLGQADLVYTWGSFEGMTNWQIALLDPSISGLYEWNGYTSADVSVPGSAGTAATGGSGSSTTETGLLREEAERVFALVNAERAAAGIPELTWDESLYNYCVDRCYMSDETYFDSHNHMEKIEIAAYGTAIGNGNDLYNGWKNSQKHHDTYMSTSYQTGAFAVYRIGTTTVAYGAFEAATEWVDKNTGEVNTAPVTVTSGTLTWYHECDQGWDAMCPLCNPEGWREAQEAYYNQ